MSFVRLAACLVLSCVSISAAWAGDRERRVGGHLGVAVPVVTVGDATSVIGQDFTSLGLSQGVTVHLSDRIAVDYEMVAYANVQGAGNLTAVVIDPGVLFKSKAAIFGIRGAMKVVDVTNFGIIPIVVKGVPVGDVVWFGELDLPVFFTDSGDGVQPALTVQIQTGFGF